MGRAINALPERGVIRRLKDPQLRGCYRLKVDGWRVIFQLDRGRHQIVVWRVNPKETAYDPLPRRSPRT